MNEISESIHVLLVEDNPGDARLFQEYLFENPNNKFSLQITQSLKSTLKALSKDRFDVLLLDLGLPDCQGSETFERVQSHTPDLPILLLTGLDDENMALEMMGKGAQDYLIKGQVDNNIISRAIRYAIERHSSDREIRRREEQLQAFVSAIPDMSMIMDPTGKLIKVFSQGDEDQFKMGEKYQDQLSSSDSKKFTESLQQTILSKQPVLFEHSIYIEGYERWFEGRMAPINSNDDAALSIICITRDITRRKLAEKAVVESEKRYRTIFETTTVSIWENDFSTIKKTIDRLRTEGITDFKAYFGKNQSLVDELFNSIVVTDINEATLFMYQADHKGQLLGTLEAIKSLAIFGKSQQLLVAIAEGRSNFQCELTNYTLKGKTIQTFLSMRLPQKSSSYQNVLVSIIDITELKQSQEKIKIQLERLNALHEIDTTISMSVDSKLTLKILLDHVINRLQVDAASILLLDPVTNELSYAANQGFTTDALKQTRLSLGHGYAGQAALDRRMIFISDINEKPGDFQKSRLLKKEGFVSYCCIPLIPKGKVKGVIEIFHRSTLENDVEWINFLEALATLAAIAIDNSDMFTKLQQTNSELHLAYDKTLEGLAGTLEMRDFETKGHSQRVTNMTVQLARAMNVDEKNIVHIRHGALLHDIGKIGIPDSILHKPGRLTKEEWQIMKKHPVLAYNLLSTIDYLRPALDIPYSHHERWDGTGYPQGLAGPEIPIAARIFAIVDVWDALNSDRPYRKAWPKEKVVAYIANQSGSCFDPEITAVFLEKLENQSFSGT